MATKKQFRSATIRDLLILKLNALYYTEQKLVKALPKMAKAASEPELRDAFKEHLAETKNHVIRIEDAMTSIGEKAKKESVEAIDGLIKDAEWCIKHIKEPKARDASLIAAAQDVENYERAGYGTAREWARIMNCFEAEDLLSQTLAEEEAANDKLTELAEAGINEAANQREAIVIM